MAGVTELNSKGNLISQIRKRDARIVSYVHAKISNAIYGELVATRKPDYGLSTAWLVSPSNSQERRQNNRPPVLKTGKTLHSHKFDSGKVDTVLTRQGEISLHSGNLKIPCGGFPALEVTNYKKLNKRNREYFWHKVDNAVKRHNILRSMGMADNHNTYLSAGINDQT
jgi:hypothetical protein